MKRQNKSMIEEVKKFYNSQSEYTRLVLLSLAVIVGGVILLFGLRILENNDSQSSLPSLLEEKPSLPSLLSDPGLPSLIRPARKSDNHTIEGIICREVYRLNVTNITFGGTTCHKWKDGKNDCLCITPLG